MAGKFAILLSPVWPVCPRRAVEAWGIQLHRPAVGRAVAGDPRSKGRGCDGAFVSARCVAVTCDHCPAEAVVVSPGTEAPRVLDLFMEARGEPERRWCLACAAAAGFPWLESEAPKGRRKAVAA